MKGGNRIKNYEIFFIYFFKLDNILLIAVYKKSKGKQKRERGDANLFIQVTFEI